MDYANITQSSISLHIPDQLSQGNFSNTDDFLKIMPPTEDNATKIPLKEKVLSVFPSLSSPRSESFVNMSTSNETSRPVSRPARRRKIVAAESDSEDSMMGATTSSQKDSCQTIGTSQQHSHSSSPSSASKLALSNPRVSTKKRQLPSSSDVSSSSETESDSSDSDESSSSESHSSTETSSDSSSEEHSDDSATHTMIAGKLVQVQSKAKPKTTTKSASRKIAQSPSPSVVRSKGSRPNKGEESSEGDNDDRDDDEEDDEEDFGGHVVKSRIGSRTDAEKLIAEILCRWWYVLPSWPPSDFDWDAALKQRKLKVVRIEEWEQLDDVDEHGFTKVYPISNFPGVYRDPQGHAIDLRPVEGKPCYSTFKNKSPVELYELLITALENQLVELRKSPYTNTEKETLKKIENNLALELKNARESLNKLKRRKCS